MKRSLFLLASSVLLTSNSIAAQPSCQVCESGRNVKQQAGAYLQHRGDGGAYAGGSEESEGNELNRPRGGKRLLAQRIRENLENRGIDTSEIEIIPGRQRIILSGQVANQEEAQQILDIVRRLARNQEIRNRLEFYREHPQALRMRALALQQRAQELLRLARENQPQSADDESIGSEDLDIDAPIHPMQNRPLLKNIRNALQERGLNLNEGEQNDMGGQRLSRNGQDLSDQEAQILDAIRRLARNPEIRERMNDKISFYREHPQMLKARAIALQQRAQELLRQSQDGQLEGDESIGLEEQGGDLGAQGMQQDKGKMLANKIRQALQAKGIDLNELDISIAGKQIISNGRIADHAAAQKLVDALKRIAGNQELRSKLQYYRENPEALKERAAALREKARDLLQQAQEKEGQMSESGDQQPSGQRFRPLPWLKQQQQEQGDDDSLLQRAHQALEGSRLSRNLDLQIDEGTIILNGAVASDQDRQEIRNRLGRIQGIREIIDDQLQIQNRNPDMRNMRNNPTYNQSMNEQNWKDELSLFNMGKEDTQTVDADQQLKAKIYDTLKDNYINKGNNAVAFDISNGKVTLKGIVVKESDKQAIGEKIGGMSGVKQLDNQIEVKPKPGSQ